MGPDLAPEQARRRPRCSRRPRGAEDRPPSQRTGLPDSVAPALPPSAVACAQRADDPCKARETHKSPCRDVGSVLPAPRAPTRVTSVRPNRLARARKVWSRRFHFTFRRRLASVGGGRGDVEAAHHPSRGDLADLPFDRPRAQTGAEEAEGEVGAGGPRYGVKKQNFRGGGGSPKRGLPVPLPPPPRSRAPGAGGKSSLGRGSEWGRRGERRGRRWVLRVGVKSLKFLFDS